MCSKIMLPNTPLHATLHERTNPYTPDVSEVNIVACLITVSLVEIQIIYLLRKSKGKRAWAEPASVNFLKTTCDACMRSHNNGWSSGGSPATPGLGHHSAPV